ncbi:hypothetical protein GMD78_05255 [Ornithinibacillus sp. L9]|uniref:Uncharacterized protein n=1 Tax=Ornithinibacillus caprae TaxID=2678566 RepID=A0A6N8FKJ3_9BACI|nr:hypothetical protein [Ornithinibacillus caprae]MUK87808.1 hypothetical protein [Ornithinibacillus caprae]
MKNAMASYFGALFFYFLSFISAFSIGLYVLLGAVLFLVLGIAKSLNLLRKKINYLFFSLVSVVIWYLLISFVDDYYLFFPFAVFS